MSCEHTKKRTSVVTTENVIEPFELTVINFDYSLAYGIAYKISNEDLQIIFKGELEGEKDTTLFQTKLESSPQLKNLGTIAFYNNLNDSYSNPCIADGSQINVRFVKGEIKKSIHLSNYYQEDIGKIIDLINRIVPSKYQIHYDQNKLEEYLRNCPLME